MSESKKPQRASKAQLQNYYKKVAQLLEQNYTTPQVCDILSTELKKHPRTIERYVHYVLKQLQKDTDRSIQHKRTEMMSSLRADLRTSYNNYIEAETPGNALKWWREYQDVKKRICELEPNGLKAESDESQTLNITFTKRD